MSKLDEVFKPIIHSIEDFRSHHDPDDLYMTLQEDLKEAKQQVKELILELITGNADEKIFTNTKHIADWGDGYRQAKEDIIKKVEDL